jgi:hypothetical protein
MKRFVEGADRHQATLLPDCLDDYVAEDNPVRVIEVFIDELDLAGLGSLRSLTIASRRLRSIGFKWAVMPVRILKTRTPANSSESHKGLLCWHQSTSFAPTERGCDVA